MMKEKKLLIKKAEDPLCGTEKKCHSHTHFNTHKMDTQIHSTIESGRKYMAECVQSMVEWH